MKEIMNNYLIFLLGSTILISFFLLKISIKLAHLKMLFDSPTNERKIHSKNIPNIGGVSFFFTFLLLVSLSSRYLSNLESIFYLFASLVIIFLFGLKDDLVGLSSSKRFLSQLIAGSILIILGNFRITEINGIFGINVLNESVSIVLSLITFVLVINSFNLIDGINGLAGSLGFLSCIIFSVYFIFVGNYSNLILIFPILGALLSFLYFNIYNARIFMGSSGSYLLGVLIYYFSILFLNDTNQIFIFNSRLGFILSLLFLPLLDTVRIFLFRIFNKKNPFHADKNHIHHLLLNLGFSQTKVLFILMFVSLTVISINFYFQIVQSTFLILIDCILFFGFVLFIRLLNKKRV